MMRQWTFMNKGVPDAHLTGTNEVGYTTALRCPLPKVMAKLGWGTTSLRRI